MRAASALAITLAMLMVLVVTLWGAWPRALQCREDQEVVACTYQ